MKRAASLRRDFVTYCIGYLLAVGLTALAFSCVFFRLLPPEGTFRIVLLLALVQIIVHMRCPCTSRSSGQRALICS